MLENHHSATTFQLLAETELLKPLERDDQLHVRRGIIKAILGTDMAKHNDQARAHHLAEQPCNRHVTVV